jgi:hypothetical protein
MIVAITGWIGSGKDTVADFLVQNHNFKKESFAASLKDAVAAVFGWDRVLLEGSTAESRAWRDQVDTWWATRLNMPQLTPRWVLQQWGTEVLRGGFHDSIWIASVENKIRNANQFTVITDCRFPNEINAIKNAGGKIFWVRRGELPSWYNLALAANEGHILARRELERAQIHASERDWIGTNFDGIIDNNSTLEHLYKQIEQFIL